MTWRIEFERAALREFEKLDRAARTRILDFLNQRLAARDDPRQLGQALRGSELAEYRLYRIADYPRIARLNDGEFIIHVISVAHRRDVYR